MTSFLFKFSFAIQNYAKGKINFCVNRKEYINALTSPQPFLQFLYLTVHLSRKLFLCDWHYRKYIHEKCLLASKSGIFVRKSSWNTVTQTKIFELQGTCNFFHHKQEFPQYQLSKSTNSNQTEGKFIYYPSVFHC